VTISTERAGLEEMTPQGVLGDPRQLSFAALVADKSRFRAWYDEALPRVYRYLLTRCGDEALAEEVTQEAFIEALRARRRFEGRSDPVTWICAIGRNRLIDHVRHDRRTAIRHLRLVESRGDLESSAWGASDERETVDRALATLLPDQRVALMFRYLDQMSVREVARLMHRSESATESLLSRARERFRLAYEGQTDA
jgi:RNA polymerase sigma-70 factor (ECF subfamily)